MLTMLVHIQIAIFQFALGSCALIFDDNILMLAFESESVQFYLNFIKKNNSKVCI